jgi:hypothetical protein
MASEIVPINSEVIASLKAKNSSSKRYLIYRESDVYTY